MIPIRLGRASLVIFASMAIFCNCRRARISDRVDLRAVAIWQKQEAVFKLALRGDQKNDDFLKAVLFFEKITGLTLHLNYYTFGVLPTHETQQDLKRIQSWYRSNGHCLHWDEASRLVNVRPFCVKRFE